MSYYNLVKLAEDKAGNEQSIGRNAMGAIGSGLVGAAALAPGAYVKAKNAVKDLDLKHVAAGAARASEYSELLKQLDDLSSEYDEFTPWARRGMPQAKSLEEQLSVIGKKLEAQRNTMHLSDASEAEELAKVKGNVMPYVRKMALRGAGIGLAGYGAKKLYDRYTK